MAERSVGVQFGVLSSQNDKLLESYEVNHDFKAGRGKNIHTTIELANYLKEHEKDKHIEVDARVIGYSKKHKEVGVARFNKKKFLGAMESNQRKTSIRSFRESIDCFGSGDGFFPSFGNRIGEDFVPLLGGPFHKQTYIYDYLRGHTQAFFAYHHDPLARFIIQTIRDFTLGRGFRVDAISDDKTEKSIANAIWRSAEEVNDLQQLMQYVGLEIGMYGEDMIWELPNNQIYQVYQPAPGDPIPTGLLPRFRTVDPSTVWEIVTHPEDMHRILFYQQQYPTQYQIYTGKDQTTGEQVSSLKYVMQQIPADQMMHHKINVVSNEKRGRGDLYPILGYLKRMRDLVNYSVIGAQKNAAWSIDTVIEGSPDDVQAYVDAMQELGTIAPAGSEFAHTAKIKRDYKNNASGGSGRGGNPVFEVVLSMCAIGVGIPVSYFGSHLSGGQTRASALVSTEPVAKKFQLRQLVYERMIKQMFARTMRRFGMGHVQCEVTFPTIIEQDVATQLKNLTLAQTEQWISQRTAATIASKELDVTEYEYDAEQEEILEEKRLKILPDVPAGMTQPLTAPAASDGDGEAPASRADTSSEARRKLAMNHGF